jgi:1-acyl-sn-glycerol-3-phosphate acyltransferase
MFKALSKAVYYYQGWSAINNIGKLPKRAVLIAAPHTSNLDMIIALKVFDELGINAKIAVKKEWFRQPTKKAIESIGGIPIDRQKSKAKTSIVDTLANLFNQHEELVLTITPEGTRSKNDKWKTGFYHVALKAKVPIIISYLDYRLREGVVEKLFYPTGNFEEDMKVIMKVYKKNGVAKFAEKFSIDKRFI